MVLPTSAAIMVLLTLYQALARLGIYLQKRVQLVLKVQQAHKELKASKEQLVIMELKVLLAHRAQLDYKV